MARRRKAPEPQIAPLFSEARFCVGSYLHRKLNETGNDAIAVLESIDVDVPEQLRAFARAMLSTVMDRIQIKEGTWQQNRE